MTAKNPFRPLRRLLLDGAAVGSAFAVAGAHAGKLAGSGWPVGAAEASADAARQATGAAAGWAGGDEAFSFGFIGDTPYSGLEANALRRVLAAMAAEPLAFVLHVGDIKSSLEACDDDLLTTRLALLDDCPHPLVLTPGDNEWTDCGRMTPPWASGGRLERLEWLRAHVFRSRESLGRRRMALQQQGPWRPHLPAAGAGDEPAPRLPENLRWRAGSLQFCTLHVVGSNNAPRQEPALELAWLLRQQANAEWLNDTVQLALREKARGLVIGLHANMRFEADRSDGWARMRSLVIAAAAEFDGPVLLLHGDTHLFRSNRLLRQSHGLANLLRVECFGSPFSSSWVQIRWDPALARAGAGTASEPFQVSVRALP